MELNSCSSQDDASTAFVRDWRLRKISPVNNKLANQDTAAPIVRRRTVITIGSVNETTIQQEDQTISASEVGETACGRISIQVKTIPKTPSFGAITEKSPIICPSLHAEEEWTSRDTVPFKSSSVSDPSWIYVPSQPDRSYSSKILQRPPWPEEKPSRDNIDSTLVDNQRLCRTLSNKKSSYTLTGIDMDPSADSRKVNSDYGITNKVFDSPKINLKPTFKMTFGDETKILRLTDTSSSEKCVPKVEKRQTTSVARSPIGYHEWLKSLDRLEGESYPNQNHSSDDEKVKHQDTKLIKSIDRTPSGTAHKCSDIINQPLGLIETSPTKSILKTVQNESEIRPEAVNLVQNQLHKDVTAGVVHEVISEVHKSTLTKPINSLIDTKETQDCTVGKSSPSLVGWVAKSNNTDSKFNKIVATNGNQVAVAPKVLDCTTSRLPTAMKVDRANSIEVVNKNQINSMRSISFSGSWKQNSNTQDGMNGPALSSGMDLSKATELVRQFFNTGNGEDADNHQSALLLATDKKPLNVTKSNLLVEDQTTSISHDYQQSAAAQSKSNGFPELQPGSVQDQRYTGNHRGRSTIKSKIPLRIPRHASSSACSHSGTTSNNNSTLTAPSVAYVDKGNNIVSSKYCAFNKAKSSINMPSKIKPPSTGSAVRTRSVENLRQTSPLSNYVLYSNIMTARDDVTSHYQ